MTAIEILYRDFGLGNESDPTQMEGALAQEYFGGNDTDKLINCMKEYAEIYAKKCLDIVAENAVIIEEGFYNRNDDEDTRWIVDQDSILNIELPQHT